MDHTDTVKIDLSLDMDTNIEIKKYSKYSK